MVSLRTCSASGEGWSCERPSEKGGYCLIHYRHSRRAGSFKPVSSEPRACAYPECPRIHSAKGYCAAHYNQKFVLGYTELTAIGTYFRGATTMVRDENGLKRCTSCTEWKRESFFNKRAKGPDGLTARCSDCGRRAALWKSYRLTPEKILELVESQGGCSICGIESPASQWHVDHDHACCPGWTTCGECVRGILCNNCNLGIGMLGDDPDIIDRAAEYLRQWRSGRVESGG